ncbi:MAG: hypothetical protein JNL21_05825 [Myxococcales bacterium]|nr:hypothetical protein [Myxococcales bacterium]
MLRISRTLSLASLPVLFVLASVSACSDDSAATGGGGSGGDATTTTSSSTKSSSSATTTSSSTTTSSATTTSSSTTGTGGGTPWPTCETQPPGSPTKTLNEIWTENPANPTEAWVPGVYVTAIANNGCTAGTACQFFIQQDESYGSLAEATHQSLRVGVAPSVAEHFVDIQVGDQVDFYGFAFRNTQDGENELLFLVTDSLQGCARTVGMGDLQPLTVTLDQLTTQGYETDYGPLFVRVDTVTGNPNMPAETFALWDTGTMPGGDITTVTSLSPFFLSGAAFTGLTDGMNTNFSEVVGVFGIFAPPADPLIKYEEIYVRATADYPTL